LDGDDHLSDLGFSELFNGGELTGLEEDLGETETELFLIDLKVVHEDGDLSLGVRSGSGHVRGQEVVTLEEFGVDDSVGETLTRDTDTFEDTIATKLVQDDVSVDFSGALLVIGDDATDEVRVGGRKGVHQGVELFLVMSSDGHELSSLLSGSRGIARWNGALASSGGWAGSTIEFGDEVVSEEVDNELKGR
jgi:hypothetical protein